ncbi:BTB/POZ domain-containing protein 6-like [Oculina patagonica]
MYSFGKIFKDTESEDMAAVEENWQTKRSTIKSRTAFIFNNELLSDVKFVVRASNGDSESKRMKMVIPAHKFVLAISSPVFFAMFYGQMAETSDSIELPDCEYESLLEMLRYLYSDEVNLSGNNVMQVLYMANKYMVPSLAGKCNEYLRDNLAASNVFCILPHAQKFENKDLEDRCWEVIEEQTEEAVTSDEFVTLERSLVESVVKREGLNVKEVELFKAVDRWATKENERQRITPDGEAKRRILGEEIVKSIRFPLMSQKEFASAVFDSYILTFQEFGEMTKHYNGVLPSSLPYKQTPRIAIHRCSRFKKILPPVFEAWWNYPSDADRINFTVNKPIKLHGIQHFGSQDGEYKVSTEVKDAAEGSSLVKQTGSYASEKDETNSYYGFDVQFGRPICLVESKEYQLVSHIKGPSSWYGQEGQASVECQGVRFTFRSTGGNNNGTCEVMGQFPALLFS